MNSINGTFKRLVTTLLLMAMLVTAVPSYAFAEETDGSQMQVEESGAPETKTVDTSADPVITQTPAVEEEPSVSEKAEAGEETVAEEPAKEGEPAAEETLEEPEDKDELLSDAARAKVYWVMPHCTRDSLCDEGVEYDYDDEVYYVRQTGDPGNKTNVTSFSFRLTADAGYTLKSVTATIGGNEADVVQAGDFYTVSKKDNSEINADVWVTAVTEEYVPEASEYGLTLLTQEQVKTTPWYFYWYEEENRHQWPGYIGGKGNLIWDGDGIKKPVVKDATEVRIGVSVYNYSSLKGFSAKIGGEDAVTKLLETDMDSKGNFCSFYSIKKTDGSEINGDITYTVETEGAAIVDKYYKYDFTVTNNNTVIINRIRWNLTYEQEKNNRAACAAKGKITIPATIPATVNDKKVNLPVSGFASTLFDDLYYIQQVTNKSNVGLILPVYDHNRYIWLNSAKTQKIDPTAEPPEMLMQGQTAVRIERYNQRFELETYDKGDGTGPSFVVEYYNGDDLLTWSDYGSNESVVSAGGISFIDWFHDNYVWVDEAGEMVQKPCDITCVKFYVEKEYESTFRYARVKSYQDYPETSNRPNTNTWAIIPANPVNGETVTKDFGDGDVEYTQYTYSLGTAEEAEKYNNGTYVLGMEVRFGAPATYTLCNVKAQNGTDDLTYTVISDNFTADADGVYRYSGSGDVEIQLNDTGTNFYNAGFYHGRNMLQFNKPQGTSSAVQYYDGMYTADYNRVTGKSIVTIPENEMKEMTATGYEFSVRAYGIIEEFPSYAYLTADTLNGKVAYADDDIEGDFLKQQEGATTCYYFDNNTDDIVFKPTPVSPGTTVTAMSCQLYMNTYVNGKLTTEPMGAPEKLLPDGDGKYTLNLSQRVTADDFERGSVHVSVKPIVSELASVKIRFHSVTNNANSVYKGAEAADNNFDLTVRVDAGTYNATLVDGENDKYYVVDGIPKGSIVNVSAVPKADCLQKIDHAQITDSNASNSGKDIKSNTGEFSIKLGELTDGSIDLYTQPVKKLVIMDENDDALESDPKVKDKYSVTHDQTFKAKLVTSVVDGFELSNEDVVGTSFYDGSKEIPATISGVNVITGGVLTATPDRLGVAGKTLTLNAKIGKETYKATIVCSANPTKADITGFKDVNGLKTADQPFDTDKSYKVTFTTGTDLSKISVFILDENGEKTARKVDNNTDGFAAFDDVKSTLNVDDDKMVDCNYAPGSHVDFAFFEGDTRIGSKYRLTFSNPVVGNNKKPTVAEDKNMTTSHELGIKLTLPSGVKASKHLFYVVEATADPDDDRTDGTDECYKDTRRWLIPSSDKSAVIDVTTDKITENDRLAGKGWSVSYDVNVKMAYCANNTVYEAIGGGGNESNPAKPVKITTKAPAFETKVTLTKKAPSKIFIGQNNVLTAIIKYSNSTTVRRMSEARLFAADGRVLDYWDGWGDSALSCDKWFSVDNVSGEVRLNTFIDPDDQVQDDEHWLLPGKYTIRIYASNGGGKSASADVQVNVVNSIGKLELTPESRRLYKPYNKKATLKTTVSYYDMDGGVKPDTKKVVWSVTDKDGNDLQNTSPLYGKVTVSNGTVSVDAKLMVDDTNPDAYTFRVKATAADWDGNTEFCTSAPILISSQTQVPTYMALAWCWTEGGVTHRDTSIVANGGTYYSDAFEGAMVYVYDQNFEQMDETECTLKISSNIIQDGERRLHLKSAGKTTITATATDGGKKSCKLEFTVIYAGADHSINTLIQKASFECADEEDYDEEFHHAFLNGTYVDVNGSWTLTNVIKNNNATNAFVNPLPDGKPFYVYVAGCRNKDDGTPDYNDNVMIDHSVSVTGGRITATEYGMFERYTRYAIIPSAPQTIVKVTDKTKGRKAPANLSQYTIKNTALSTKAAAKITTRTKSIVNNIWDLQEDAAGNFYNIYDPATPDGADNPNDVTYTIDKIGSYTAGQNKKLVVNITMDPIKDGDNNNETFARFLGLETVEDRLKGKIITINQDGTFNIKFFKTKDETITNSQGVAKDDTTIIYFDEIAKGNYTFYATVGQANNNDTEFEALAKPTKITVKVDEVKNPTVKFAASKVTLGQDEKVAIPTATITNGSDIERYFLAGINDKGVINGFTGLFQLDGYGGIKLRDQADLGMVMIGTGNKAIYHQVRSLWELRSLKYGKLRGGDDWELLGTSAQQVTAYKNWVKANCSGFIGYGAFRLDGSIADDNYSPITIDMESFIDGQVTSNCLNNKGFWDDVVSGYPGYANNSPEIKLKPVAGANAYAVFMLDTTANNWLHWKVQIPKDEFSTVGDKIEIVSGKYHEYNPGDEENGIPGDEVGYIGPYPPSGTHMYEVYVIALKNTVGDDTFNGDSSLKLNKPNDDIDKLISTVGGSGNILDIAVISGKFAYRRL